MIRVLLSRNLRQHTGLLGILSASLLLFQWAVVWVADRIEAGPGFRELFSGLLPPGMQEAILGQFGFATFGGAVSFGYQHPFSLVAAIALVTVMATIPAREREAGLLDLILARPLTRTQYMAACGLLVLLAALLPPLALLGGGTLGLVFVETSDVVSWTAYLPAATGLSFLLLAIGGYTLLLSTQAKRRGLAIGRAVGITLFFYWLDFMGGYWDLLEQPQRISPFHYFDPAAAASSGLNLGHMAVLGGVALAGFAGAFLSFSRQDL